MNDRSMPDSILLATWPNQVFLHHGASQVPPYRNMDEASCSDYPSHANDIRYVRADLAGTETIRSSDLAELRAIVERLHRGCSNWANANVGSRAVNDCFRALALLDGMTRRPAGPPGCASAPDSTASFATAEGSGPAVVAVPCEVGKGVTAGGPEAPSDTADEPDPIVQASGFQEPMFRAMAAVWAAEFDEALDAGTGTPNTDPRWAELVDSVTGAIVRAYDAGRRQQRDDTAALMLENARLAELMTLARGLGLDGNDATLSSAIDRALAGKRTAIVELIEQAARALMPRGGICRLKLTADELEQIWSNAVEKAHGTLLAPICFAQEIADRAKTRETEG